MKVWVVVLTTCFLNVASTFAAERVKLNGYAEWRHNDVLIVEGQRVRVSARTLFLGRARGGDLEAIPLGYEIKVDGYRAPDGSVLARKLEAKPNGNAMFEGQLSAEFDAIEHQWRARGYVYEDQAGSRRLGALVEDGPQVDRVRRIVSRLVPPSQNIGDFRAYVIRNEAWNAMAAPNGSVFVFSGLLAAVNDDELAIIVGHELVHATHEHSRRQYKRNFWTQLGLASALAIASGPESDCDTGSGLSRSGLQAGIETAAVIGALAFQNGYSRQHEDQADRVGLRYAHEGGYDVSRAPELWRRFAVKYGSQPAALNFFFGSHSTPSARSRHLEREIRVNYR